MKLSTQYYNLTKDATPFNAEWLKAMGTIVTIITEMQEVKKSFFMTIIIIIIF